METNPRRILADVAGEFGLTVEELVGKSRGEWRMHARRVALGRLRKMGFLSTTDIAGLFGRDHATILYWEKEKP